MRKILLSMALALAAGGAQAQIKCWNEGGKRVCGDAPPAGAKVTTLQTPSGPAPAPSAATKDGKAASKGPMTAAEREQDFRKRQQEAAKSAEKTAAAEKDAAARKENCLRARENLAGLEGGQRIMRTDAKGERYYLDDNQIAQEAARARQIVQESCN